jgi:hypothetical protein
MLLQNPSLTAFRRHSSAQVFNQSHPNSAKFIQPLGLGQLHELTLTFSPPSWKITFDDLSKFQSSYFKSTEKIL